ncbi:MAG: hypothetical protein MJZ50_05720 [Treponema sp.]|nr:hypothetical protein [Treponema sp.]
MSDSPKRTLEPGTLDKTRRNIGPIDPKEALAMQKILGGEILQEKSVPVDTSNMPRQHRRNEVVIHSSGRSSADVADQSARAGARSAGASMGAKPERIEKKVRTDEDLPEISPRELKLMDRTMMSSLYNIKPDYGVFNVFYRISSRNKERVKDGYGSYVIKRHVEHINQFVGTIKTFIQISPDSYKSKIAADADLKFRFLRAVGKWQVKDVKIIALDLENSKEVTIPMLIPITRAIYRLLLSIYYIGDQQVSLVIKEIYNDLSVYPNADTAKLQMLAKQALTEWLYLSDQVIKGMYPLLMRMCSSEYVGYPDFFKAKIQDILKFLGISKFDLILPDKKKKAEEQKKEEPKKEEEKEKNEDSRKMAGAKDDVVKMGLKILDQLFPEAGFMKLDSNPDMYPYFQPIYNFVDGFNTIHPSNPLQITVVLIVIIEDFFKGCRNINFNIEADEDLAQLDDKLDIAMGEWASYYEDLFGKKLGDYLRTYVNSIYSQKDYASSKFGKENLNNILWRVKYYFLPHYKFNAPVLQKPINDTKYKPLYGRTDYLRDVLGTIVRRIDENSAKKGTVLGVLNPWDPYSFDLPNAISKRIDVMLGAKRDPEITAATNANLIKYTYCIISVLDWWVNNRASPAYASSSEQLYRISEKDGAPLFSVKTRTDQNQLFADGVKKAIEHKKNK